MSASSHLLRLNFCPKLDSIDICLCHDECQNAVNSLVVYVNFCSVIVAVCINLWISIIHYDLFGVITHNIDKIISYDIE